MVRALIGSGADVNKSNMYGKTVLFYAVQQINNENIVRALIESGADVNKFDEDGKTVLFYAVQQSNNENVVRALIESGADVNKTNKEDQTALFDAVKQSTNDNVIRALIGSGADVNKSDSLGLTALFYAFQHSNNENVVRALIESGADVHKTYTCGQTTLFYSVIQSKNENVIRAFIESGADVNATDSLGRTALFYAVQQSNNENVIRALIESGADVNATDSLGRTALFYAVHQSNNENVVQALIESGADVNKSDSSLGQTALFYAVQQSNNENVVRALIQSRADVNKTRDDGKTALFDAVRQSNNENVIRVLIESGADVNKSDKNGQTALFDGVRQSNNENVVRALIDSGADINNSDFFDRTALFYAVQQSNNENVVRALIESGADVNKTRDDGKTALFCAVQEINNENIVRTLVESCADVNITDDEGQTALFNAVQQSNNENVVRALIECRAEVNRTDCFGRTVLFYAVQQSNNENVIRALIESGADVNKSDEDGRTALFYVVQGSNDENVIRALIEDGRAFVNERDRYGRTALFHAMENLNLKRARYLIEKGGNLHLKDIKNVSIFSTFIENCITNDRNVLNFFASDIFHGQQERGNLINAFLDIIYCHTPFLTINARLFSTSTFKIISEKKPLIEALTFSQYHIPDGKDEALSRCISISQMTSKCKHHLPQLLFKLNQLGANPNSVDSDGNTALHYATLLPVFGVAQNINMDICEKLMHLGAIVDVKNHQNETPLLFSFSTYYSMELIPQNNQRQAIRGLAEVCRFLLNRGSSVDETSQSGKSVFHLMIDIIKEGLALSDESLRQGVLEEAIQLFELFSKSKGKRKFAVNKRDVDQNSPLHLWASLSLTSPQDYKRNVTTDLSFGEFLKNIFNQLFECGIALNARNKNDETPLHICKTWNAVKILIGAGANPKDVDSSGRQPLLVAARSKTFLRKLDFFYPDVSEDAKPYWDRIVDMGLDPWTADKHGETVLSILIQSDEFVLAKALVDVACEQICTKSETFTVCLLNTICKDKSILTNWKTVLVQEILKSKKGPTTATAPLHLCCRNIIETGVFDDKLADKTHSPIRTPISEDYEINDEESPPTKRRRMDEQISEDEAQTDSVHCELLKVLRLYGADGESCLGIAETCPPLKDLLVRPIDIDTVSLLIPWTSISNKCKDKLAKVARRQECDVVNQYWLHKDPIGSGSFGDVFAGINEKDGREVAIKRIVKSRLHRPEDKREITNLTALADCEKVVRYLLFFEEEKFSYVVLELMEGNLDEYLDDSKFDKSNNTRLCEDVVKGLKYLHEQNILHRDLKPGNILYKTHPKLCLKIADFGLSRRIEFTGCTTVYGTNAGTRRWIAPEVLMCTQDNSKSSDVFSCGLLLHYILSVKKHPFSKDNRQVAHEIERNITKGKMKGWDDSLSPEATHLLKTMLENDRNNRPIAREALDHPLFWSQERKIDLLVAAGNQPVFEYPRAGKSTCLTPVETDLEKSCSTIVRYGKWNDPGYLHMPAIYAEMTQKRKSYDTTSAVELVRFIRNAYSHVSEDKRPTLIRKLLLEDFVFLDYFPHLVMEVYKAVTTHGWDQTREEIKYAMNK